MARIKNIAPTRCGWAAFIRVTNRTKAQGAFFKVGSDITQVELESLSGTHEECDIT